MCLVHACNYGLSGPRMPRRQASDTRVLELTEREKKEIEGRREGGRREAGAAVFSRASVSLGTWRSWLASSLSGKLD